ncbi:hypothetical protein ZIOFF_063242 [Zingiber officinale]|uniref:DYW domain-containing protein n=1 Tax=Zingiber officinale TaxID=94328 RepID=A0A8J5F6D3_ZINOF|nr:hypothetical protein ZIOFF_063242 [Zingiber officinale]
MYIKCGCLQLARQVFDEMAERTVVSWSAMIGGHAMHGQAEEALELFSKMEEASVEPNAVTFVGLLHACSHIGLLQEGRQFFRSMTQDYGIVPEIEHYGCMVDLLSRAGLLEEAREFINKMPIEPNSVVWGALLGGAKVHKNIKMGEEAIHNLMELDPRNDGYYVVLSNIYADAERWEDVAKIRRMMKDRGLKKTPGWSTISLDGVVHSFVAAVLLDMDEKNKERVLYHHSEKLAAASGLMNTANGTPIRIMKNLRVCSDCHAALKLISEITNREIVVRDRNRGLGDAAGRTRLGLASISLSHYINVATLSSNAGTVDSFNDGSAEAELKANEVGHSNWQEEKAVLSRGSNPGHCVSPDYKQQKLKGSFTSSPTARGINSGSNIWECDRVVREDGSLTREETNGSFQSKTTKVDDVQSNSWTANPRIFPLSRSASSRRSSRGKSILENHKDKLTANTSGFAREQWGRKSSSPSVSPSPRRKDSSRLQFEGSSDIGLVKVNNDVSDLIPSTVGNDMPETITESSSLVAPDARARTYQARNLRNIRQIH